MNLSSCKLLANENIHPEIIQFLKEAQFDIISLPDEGLNGKSDLEILMKAIQSNRVVLTQDADFGKLVYTMELQFPGIIYLRPGHISSSFHIQTLRTLLSEPLELIPPFILIGENNGSKIKIRLRNSVNV